MTSLYKGVFILSLIVFCNIKNIAQEIVAPHIYFKDYGKQYHFQHEIMNYIQLVAQYSKLIKIEKYGETNEGRPLHLIYIGLPEHLENLEEIRSNHIQSLESNKISKNAKNIVWMSFGVHGNEAGTTASVPKIVHSIVTGTKDTLKWLQNSIIIIDPCANPDGYDRYVNYIRSVSHKNFVPEFTHREHMEGWPSGRYNHYLFDLNRDWAWQTQIETAQRVKKYHMWSPHIHADFHEMGYNKNYFFAPAAEPLHKYISDFQRKFQFEVGKNHAKYFDKEGWLYWTRESFDLFYPSYGDTYPTYCGAVGMTYEMAGNTSSGRAILLDNGDTLTVGDKIMRNTVVALSTLEMAAQNSEQLQKNLIAFCDKNRSNPVGKHKTYFIKNAGNIHSFLQLLQQNNILYSVLDQEYTSSMYDYNSGKTMTTKVNKGDIVIDAHQTNSLLLQVLMEENPYLSDSATYDITSWALPFAFGVQCYGLAQAPKSLKTINSIQALDKIAIPKDWYAVTVPWTSMKGPQFLAELLNDGWYVKMSNTPTIIDNQKIGIGALLITHYDNRKIPNVTDALYSKLKKMDITDYVVHNTGFSEKIGDLGGSKFNVITAPKVLTFSGKQVSTTALGEIWHLFDNILNYPIQIVDIDMLQWMSLDQFNTIILPDGYYTIDEETNKRLGAWVNQGGRLIVMEDILSQLEDGASIFFKYYADEEEKNNALQAAKTKELDNRENAYGYAEQRYLTSSAIGATIKNQVDTTHPMTYGIGEHYYSLKNTNFAPKLQLKAWNIIYVNDDYTHYGFIGQGMQSKLKKTANVAVRNMGKGTIVYMVDNPLFRGFRPQGLQLFSNAVFINFKTLKDY